MKANAFVKLKESFESKTIPQRIRICIGLTLVITFIFFVIKGNFFDTRTTTAPPQETSQSADNGESSPPSQEESNAQSDSKDSKVRFNISWLDIGILAALFTAYGVHKYREKKREKRL